MSCVEFGTKVEERVAIGKAVVDEALQTAESEEDAVVKPVAPTEATDAFAESAAGVMSSGTTITQHLVGGSGLVADIGVGVGRIFWQDFWTIIRETCINIRRLLFTRYKEIKLLRGIRKRSELFYFNW